MVLNCFCCRFLCVFVVAVVFHYSCRCILLLCSVNFTRRRFGSQSHCEEVCPVRHHGDPLVPEISPRGREPLTFRQRLCQSGQVTVGSSHHSQPCAPVLLSQSRLPDNRKSCFQIEKPSIICLIGWLNWFIAGLSQKRYTGGNPDPRR